MQSSALTDLLHGGLRSPTTFLALEELQLGGRHGV
jgi:hypothetical protein